MTLTFILSLAGRGKRVAHSPPCGERKLREVPRARGKGKDPGFFAPAAFALNDTKIRSGRAKNTEAES
jgi:hypothetical protein